MDRTCGSKPLRLAWSRSSHGEKWRSVQHSLRNVAGKPVRDCPHKIPGRLEKPAGQAGAANRIMERERSVGMKRPKHFPDRRERALRPRQAMSNRAAALREAIAREHGLLPDS